MAENKKLPLEKSELNDGRKCHTCQTIFHNIFDYADHLESKDHIKNAMKVKYGEKYLKAKLKLEQNNTRSNDSDSHDESLSSEGEVEVYTCELCEKVCTGLLSYKLHLNGKNHKKMLNKKKLLKEIRKNEQPHTGTACSNDQVLDFNLLDSKLASSDITCKICEKRFSGPENFKQHMKGEAHKKKLKLIKNIESADVSESAQRSKDYECDTCNKKLSNAELYKQHIDSNGHLKKKQHMETMSKMAELSFQSGEEIKMECDVCQKTFSGVIPLKTHLESTNHKKQEKKKMQLNELCKNHPEIQIPSKVKSEDSDEETLIICNICSIPFSGPESALDHVTSQKHKKAAKYHKFMQKSKCKHEIAHDVSNSQVRHLNSDRNYSGDEFEII